MSFEEIEAEALRLPEPDRARLFSSLLQSFDEPPQDVEVAQVWAEEAVKRDQAMEREGESGIPADEVLKELLALLR